MNYFDHIWFTEYELSITDMNLYATVLNNYVHALLKVILVFI